MFFNVIIEVIIKIIHKNIKIILTDFNIFSYNNFVIITDYIKMKGMKVYGNKFTGAPFRNKR